MNSFREGHYVLEDALLCHCVDNVRRLLANFVPGNNLSAELNPNTKCLNPHGVSSYSVETQTPNTLFLLTSGTTGNPKWVEKKNMSEFMSVSYGTGDRSDSWILVYHPYRWAGISVLAHIIKSRSQLYIPVDFETKNVLSYAKKYQVSHISLTPSRFRKFLIEGRDDLKQCHFKQITFGGEWANQNILDEAKNLFPHSRVTHVYASTEHGNLCSVSDGLEGFPIGKFSDVCDFLSTGELVIDNKPTGDFWEAIGNRFHFRGRESDVVNVGGNKISLSSIENTLLNEIPNMKQVKARVEQSPILGSLILAEYMGNIEPKDVMLAARRILPKYALAKVEKVEKINLSESGKLKR